MQTDLTTRLLLTGILLCLGILVAQGGHHGSDSAAGRYRAMSERSGMRSILLRGDTVTGDLWRAEDVLDADAHWFVYPDPLTEPLTPSDEAEPQESKAPAPPPGPGEADLKTVELLLSVRSTPDKRIWAADTLGASPADNARVVPLLNKMLSQTDPTVLVAVLRNFGRRGDPSTLPKLREFLDHPDPQIQSAAKTAVSQIAGETPDSSAQGAR